MTAQLFLEHVYSCFGLSDSALTDREPQFDSEFWQELCKSLEIKSKLIITFHSQTNGGTEWVNREIQLYLSVFCINNPSSWSQALKKAEFVHNNRPHADWNQSLADVWSIPQSNHWTILQREHHRPSKTVTTETMEKRCTTSSRICKTKDERKDQIYLHTIKERR